MSAIVFNSIFEIYPDGIEHQTVIGFRPWGSQNRISFPLQMDVGDAIPDNKGRFHSKDIGLEPIFCKPSDLVIRCCQYNIREVWFGDAINRDKIESVYVPVHTIKKIAFADNVTRIGRNALAGFPGLKTVFIPASVELVSRDVFGVKPDKETVEGITLETTDSIRAVFDKIKERIVTRDESDNTNLCFYKDTLEHWDRNTKRIPFIGRYPVQVECSDGKCVAFVMDETEGGLLITGLTRYGRTCSRLEIPVYVNSIDVSIFQRADRISRVTLQIQRQRS